MSFFCRNIGLHFYSWHKNSQFKLIFRLLTLVYVPSNRPGEKTDNLPYRLNNRMSLACTPQYHIRHLDLDFKSWKLESLVQLLSTLPLLIALKVQGFFHEHFL